MPQIEKQSSAVRGGARPGAGRKKGKVSQAKRDLAEMAKKYAEVALKTLVDVATDAKAPEAARVSAANGILDRAYGKPMQAVHVAGTMAGALTVTYVTAPTGPAPTPSAEDYETEG